MLIVANDFATELSRAIEADEIDVEFQPLIDLRDGAVMRLEVLARWHTREGVPVSPATFVPAAEKAGLSSSLTGIIARKSFARLCAWRERLPELRVALNLSALDLHERTLPAQLLGPLQAAGAPSSALAVEVTESSLMTDPDAASDALASLRTLGVRVDIDDFGTGYSSLGRLAELPLDGIKIDRRFVTGMVGDHKREAICRATIALGHDLGLEVSAEGIEDCDTWELLGALGCDSGQGYIIARPMPAADVDAWLEGWASGLGFIRRSGIERGLLAAEPGATVGRPVLVVDDEPAIRALIRQVLEDEGFEVIDAADGAEALRFVERSNPRVILLDMAMPTLDGRGFTAAMRRRGHRIPIVVMTAGSSAERWAKELRADAFLSKPLDLDDLIGVTSRFARPN